MKAVNMSSRLDAIIAMHTQDYDHATDDDDAPLYWGFYPRNLEKKTIEELKKDVKIRRNYYRNPLLDFRVKLENAARRWMKYYDIDWSDKALRQFDSLWENCFDDKGNLRFQCEMIETQDPRLLAWSFEWTGPGQAPLTNTNNMGLIKAMPCIVVLFLQDWLSPRDGQYEHFEEAEKLTKVLIEDMVPSHPYVLSATNSENRHRGEDTTHVPISMVLDTMSIALELDIYNLPIEYIPITE